MIRSRPLAAISRLHSDRGSAVVGFAIGAPLVAIIATYCIGLSGFVWSREMAADIVRVQTRLVALHAISQANADQRIRENFAHHGWTTDSLQWNYTSAEGILIVGCTAKFHSQSLPMTPIATVTESAVEE